ncbi:MAG: protein-disulfide reductase DsbD family protein [Spirosomataceae bacterium]
MKRLLFIIGLIGIGVSGMAQDAASLIKWEFRFSKPSLDVGDEVEAIFSAQIQKGWRLYTSRSNETELPAASFEFAENGSFEVLNQVKPIAPIQLHDDKCSIERCFFAQQGEFRSKIRVTETTFNLRGVIQGQVCNEQSGLCLPFKQTFQF